MDTGQLWGLEEACYALGITDWRKLAPNPHMPRSKPKLHHVGDGN